MSILIKGIDMPKFCKCEEYNCFAWDDEKFKCKITEWKKPCPLIEIDENDPMLLEFLNEFDKWRAYKELMDSIRMAQKKGEADDGNLHT